jgi:hypothetical protein
MKYPDGRDILPGDLMLIGGKYQGRVIACIDSGRYLPGEDCWSYLGRGIMVETDLAGLIHYDKPEEHFELLQRMEAN